VTAPVRFAYFYLMRDGDERVRVAVPRHVSYWKELQLGDYAGGPFRDRTGGLITFAAPGRPQAQEIVETDPFVSEDLIESYWLKEWVPE